MQPTAQAVGAAGKGGKPRRGGRSTLTRMQTAVDIPLPKCSTA